MKMSAVTLIILLNTMKKRSILEIDINEWNDEILRILEETIYVK